MNDEPITLEEQAAADEASDARAGRQMGIAAVIITVFLTLGKFMGLGKEMLLASLGAGRHTDAYKLAYNNVIFLIYTRVEKLMRPTYLPEFVRVRREEGETRAWQVASVMTGFQFLLLTVLAGLCVVYARQILLTLGPALAESPEDLERGVFMLRIMAPALLLFSLSVMPELTLHSYKRFTLPAIAEASFRTGVVVLFAILLVTVWPGQPPDGVYGVAWAVVFGGCLRLLVQLPGLRERLGLFRLTANVFKDRSARIIIGLMPPVVLGLVFSAIRSLADGRFGTEIGAGAYTCLDFARRIPDTFLQTLAMAVSFVVYPFLSEWAVRQAKDKMADALVSTVRAMAFIFIPTSVALMLISLPVIRLIYLHGEFTPEQAEWSAVGVYWYAPGLFLSSLDAPVNHWYFAFKDTLTPNLMGVVFVIVHVLIGYLGVYHLGVTVKGQLSFVAAALTISKSGKVLVLLWMLRKRVGHIDWPKVLVFAVKLAICVAVMAVGVWMLEHSFEPFWETWQPPIGDVKVTAFANIVVNVLAAMVLFLGSAALLRIEEISIVWEMFRKGLSKVRGKLGAGRGD